jgi:hypothetical protein
MGDYFASVGTAVEAGFTRTENTAFVLGRSAPAMTMDAPVDATRGADVYHVYS